MRFPALDLPAWSALLAAIAYSALAARALLKRASTPFIVDARLLFAAAIAATAAWGWSELAAAFDSAPAAIAARVFDLLRYAAWFAFLLLLLVPAIGRRRPRGLGLLIPAAAVLIAVGIAIIVFDGPPPLGDRKGSRAALFEAVALAVFGLILVEQLFRSVTDDARWNAKPLCLGLALLFAFDFYLYSQAVLFTSVDPSAASIRGAIHAFAALLLTVAPRRDRDWVARLRISRAAAFHSTAVVLAGAYLLFVAAIGYYIRFFGGDWGSALQLALLFIAVAGLVALAVSGTMRSHLRVLVGKHFFNYRYDYREEWLRFTTMLSARSSPAEMGVLVVRALADLVESPSGALWLREPGQGPYLQSARWNSPAVTERMPIDSSLVSFFLRTGWVVDLERYRAGTEHYAGLELPPWLREARQWWLAVPLTVGDELVGFVALGPARTAFDVNWEVLDLLKTASRQAAGFLAQMQATEALLEARKFDSFNRMSAFVVHDLKNIVTQLSLMLTNARRLHANPEFQQDMMATVENSLEKMRKLMLQLREGEPPAAGHSGVDVAPIARRLEAMAASRGRTIDVQILDPVVTRGHEARIERVIGHVVQNALDATRADDKVWLKVRRMSGQAQVEVGDTGAGMTPEYVRTALFKPFQSTKDAGMGIGAYESYQYVRELGGSISVDSEPGRGTVMRIALPLFEVREASVLQMSSAK